MGCENLKCVAVSAQVLREMYRKGIRRECGKAAKHNEGFVWTVTVPRGLGMYEYNELTKELLKQGYDAKNFPDYVKIPSGRFGSGNPLENIYGGFEYKRFYADEFVYKTGCGMFVKGIEVLSDMSCEKFHSHENNNPVIRCPFMKTETCEETFYCVNEWCECHRTEEPYSSDFCLTKEREKKAEHIKEVYRQFSESRNGRVCENHMRYVEKTDSIKFSYTPSHCAVACFHPDFCPILNKPLDTKKGNVFYDVKKIYPGKKREGENISLFDKEEYISIEKGKRVFNKPVSMDICNAYVKVQSHEIAEMWKLNNSVEWLFNEGFRFEILNIRAEKKETRDIWQDIQDIKEGATIIHESDKIQQKKDEKRQRKEDAKEKLKRKIIKKVESGETLSMADQRHIGKLFEPGEFQKIKNAAKQKPKEVVEEQLTLF